MSLGFLVGASCRYKVVGWLVEEKICSAPKCRGLLLCFLLFALHSSVAVQTEEASVKVHNTANVSVQTARTEEARST